MKKNKLSSKGGFLRSISPSRNVLIIIILLIGLLVATFTTSVIFAEQRAEEAEVKKKLYEDKVESLEIYIAEQESILIDKKSEVNVYKEDISNMLEKSKARIKKIDSLIKDNDSLNEEVDVLEKKVKDKEARVKAKAEAEARDKAQKVATAKANAKVKAQAHAHTQAKPQVKAKSNVTTKVAVASTKTPSRSNEKIANAVNFEATAYTAYCYGCSGITATGIDVRNTIYENGHRIIAVDPSVIALGSLVRVRAGGETFTAIAGDTGGKIKGYRIDILMSNKSVAMAFGRQNISVQVLRSGRGN